MLRRIFFQPDFHPGSPQFAGLLLARSLGLFKQKGLKLTVLPLGKSGETAAEVAIAEEGAAGLTVASTEQNILLPCIRAGARVQAVGAMFGSSPLALAELPGQRRKPKEKWLVGAHEDTVELFRKILRDAEVIAVPREAKLEMLAAEKIHSVQVYDITEPVQLQRMGLDHTVRRLEGENGAMLGYSQVLFASSDALRDHDSRIAIKDFLDVTFEGWRLARLDPLAAAKATLDFIGEHSDGSSLFPNDLDFQVEGVRRCCDYVRRARCAGTLGAIDGRRWARACEWLGGSGGRPSLESTLYAPDPLLVDGDSMAAKLLTEVKATAGAMSPRPRLVVVSVGKTPEGHTAEMASEREQAAPTGQSWFNKARAGAENNIDVEHVDLPESTTTSQLLRVLSSIVRNSDGVQLMWPFPPHIDGVAAYSAIPPQLDVDGAHYIGRSELRDGTRGTTSADFKPVTPQAVLEVLENQGVHFASSHAVVIGRSRILGSPLAHALLAVNATVTIAHSYSENCLQELCSSADIVISCAGEPGLIKGHWLKPGACAISVGTRFCKESESLLPDIEGDLESFRHCSFVATAPGGIGPLSLAVLFRNVVESAKTTRGLISAGADDNTPPAGKGDVDCFLRDHAAWSVVDGQLLRVLDLASHTEVADFIRAAAGVCDRFGHHVAESMVEHRCKKGVRLTMKLYTTSTGGLTEFDLRLGRAIESIIADGSRNAKAALVGRGAHSTCVHSRAHEVPAHVVEQGTTQFLYKLPAERIAAYPAETRGASRLLVYVPAQNSNFTGDVAANAARGCEQEQLLTSGGRVYDSTFSQLADVMPAYAHLVFNESRVFSARVRAKAAGTESAPVEVLFLSPMAESADPTAALLCKAAGQVWKAMIRGRFDEGAELRVGGLVLQVQGVLGEWIEEGEADGIEAAVRLAGEEAEGILVEILERLGEVPLPPYLEREAEEEDVVNYQTVYAAENQTGSVAAPTAGLHFTPDLLDALKGMGVRSTSLSLHVGAGTFKPVTADKVGGHAMHAEPFSLTAEALGELRRSAAEGRPIVAVGTTSARVLESLYCMAGRSKEKSADLGHLGQWDAYAPEDGRRMGKFEALDLLYERAVANDGKLYGSTSLCITPAYDCKVIDGAITNFHAPDSTLMMLVAALAGGAEEIKEVYEHAVAKKYRFLSYGDSSLIIRKILAA